MPDCQTPYVHPLYIIRYYCKQFGGRAQLLQAIHDAWVGGGSDTNVCFEVQPIAVTPAQLKQGSFDLPSLQQTGGTAVLDINSDAVQALDAKG